MFGFREIKKAKGEASKQERGETPSSDGAERLKLGGKEQKAGTKTKIRLNLKRLKHK